MGRPCRPRPGRHRRRRRAAGRAARPRAGPWRPRRSRGAGGARRRWAVATASPARAQHRLARHEHSGGEQGCGRRRRTRRSSASEPARSDAPADRVLDPRSWSARPGRWWPSGSRGGPGSSAGDRWPRQQDDQRPVPQVDRVGDVTDPLRRPRARGAASATPAHRVADPDHRPPTATTTRCAAVPGIGVSASKTREQHGEGDQTRPSPTALRSDRPASRGGGEGEQRPGAELPGPGGGGEVGPGGVVGGDPERVAEATRRPLPRARAKHGRRVATARPPQRPARGRAGPAAARRRRTAPPPRASSSAVPARGCSEAAR